MEDLKNLSTAQLVEELASRKGVEKSASGLYQPLKIRRKWEKRRPDEIECDCVLMVFDHESDHM